MLNKSLCLYERDDKGVLIPQEVTIKLSNADKKEFPELVKEKIMVTPMTRGEIKKMFNLGGKATDIAPETDKDTDAELIVAHCHNPVFTKEELVYAKPHIVRSVVRTIFAESGLKLDESSGSKKVDDEDEFGKN